MTTTAISAGATTRHDRAALGVIATYLHELTEHGRPRERDEDAERAAENVGAALAGRARRAER